MASVTGKSSYRSEDKIMLAEQVLFPGALLMLVMGAAGIVLNAASAIGFVILAMLLVLWGQVNTHSAVKPESE